MTIHLCGIFLHISYCISYNKDVYDILNICTFQKYIMVTQERLVPPTINDNEYIYIIPTRYKNFYVSSRTSSSNEERKLKIIKTV